jgi:U3 small nucleolar RNA-associated protein 10
MTSLEQQLQNLAGTKVSSKKKASLIFDLKHFFKQTKRFFFFLIKMTSLEQQLQNLAGTKVSSKKKASLIFDLKQAADIDRETIYLVSVQALEALALMDKRFSQFKKTLFSPALKDQDRNLLTFEENQKLDRSIDLFMRTIQPLMLHPLAFKALEWLIRRFEICTMNVEIIIETILPFHTSIQFAKFISILEFKKTSQWKFFETLKKTKIGLKRNLLVQMIAKNTTLITLILKMV